MSQRRTRNSNNKQHQKPKSSSISVLSNNNDICPDCENTVKDNDKGIICDCCDHWWHSSCGKISPKEYEIIGKNPNLKWFCNDCNSKEKDKDNTNVNLTNQLTTMMKLMNTMNDRLAKLENKNQSDKEIIDIVDVKVNESLLDIQEKEKRKLNLVIVNLPESQGTSPEDCKNNENTKIQKLINEIVPEKKVQIKNHVRLGQKNIGHKNQPRLLKITVDTEEAKKEILIKAATINRNSDSKNKIYINPDYTAKEREIFRNLRQELKERSGKGEKNLIIRNGKIVERSFAQETEDERGN